MFEENLYRPVGRVSLWFAELETQLTDLLHVLTQCSLDVAHILVEPLSISQKLDTLKAFIAYRRDKGDLSETHEKELSSLLGHVNELLGPRNTLIHGMILKSNQGNLFACFTGRPPRLNETFPATADAINELADKLEQAATRTCHLLLEVQGYQGTPPDDITLPIVARQRKTRTY